MEKLICCIIIILNIGSTYARTPERLYYNFLQRELTQIEHPFNKSDLKRIKEVQYSKVRVIANSSNYTEYLFDKQGRVIEIKSFYDDLPISSYWVDYYEETELPTKIIYQEDVQMDTYTTNFIYNPDNRLIGLNEVVFQEINGERSCYSYFDLRLHKINSNETILKEVNTKTDSTIGFYYLNSDNLITKITRKYAGSDSISIKKIDENKMVTQYWYKFKKNYHLGGEKFYVNDTIQKTKTYYQVSNDTIKSPQIREIKHFYYDIKGQLIRKSNNYAHEIFSYHSYNSLPLHEMLIMHDSIAYEVKYKYYKTPIKVTLSSDQYIFQLLWSKEIDKAIDTIQRKDTISREFLDICATIIYKTSRTKKKLEKGKILVEQSIDIQEHPKNLMINAMYYYYFRKEKEALKYINKAISLAKEMEIDTTEYEGCKRYFLNYKPPKIKRR